MKLGIALPVALLAGLGVLAGPGVLWAQSTFTNRVLELDGGYVELPPDIFNDLDEATIEAWVRWDDFQGQFKRVFTYGDARQDLSIGTLPDSTTLWFVMCDAQRQLHDVTVPGFSKARQWCHVAAVSGSGGMRLYADGALLGTNNHIGSFS